jgi:S1-C subfamily serine protease
MPIVYCKSCGKKNRAPDSAIGKMGKCSQCGTAAIIPAHDDTPPATAPTADLRHGVTTANARKGAMSENTLAVWIIAGILLVGSLGWYVFAGRRAAQKPDEHVAIASEAPRIEAMPPAVKETLPPAIPTDLKKQVPTAKPAKAAWENDPIVEAAPQTSVKSPAKEQTVAEIIRAETAKYKQRPESPLLTPEQIFEKCKDSVFVLHTFDANGKAIAQGSGFVIKSLEGNLMIVTNAHVIRDAFSVDLRDVHGEFSMVNFTLHVTKSMFSQDADIAFLPVPKGFQSKEPIRLGLDVKIGSAVFAIGAPQGLEFSFTRGIVSQVRKLKTDDEFEMIQTDASVSPGSSGGPLLNEYGEAVGMITLGSRAALDANNLNFAVPAIPIMIRQIWVQDDKPISLAEEVAEGHCHAGYVNLFNGEWDEATKCYDKAIATVPGYMPAYVGRASCHSQRTAYGNPADENNRRFYRLAIADYSVVIASGSDEQKTTALGDRAVLFELVGDLDAGLRDCNEYFRQMGKPNAKAFEKLIESIGAPGVYYTRAKIKDRMGDTPGAKADYDNAVRLIGSKFDAKIRFDRALFKMKHSDIDGALADFDDIIEKSPKNGHCYWSRGEAKKAKGDLRGSEADLQKARELGYKDVKGR